MSWSRRASRTSRGGGGEGVGRALASIGGVDVDGGGTSLDGGDAPFRRGTKTDGASRRRGDSRRGGSRRGGARRGGEARGKDGEARGKDGEARGKDAPRRGGDTPRRGGDTPRRETDAPRREKDAPRREKDASRRGKDASRRHLAIGGGDGGGSSFGRRRDAIPRRARARTRRAPRRVGDETDSLDGESSSIARVAFVGDVRSASACGDGGGDARGVAFGGAFARVRDARDGASRARAGFRRGGNARDSRRDGDGARRARVGARRREGYRTTLANTTRHGRASTTIRRRSFDAARRRGAVRRRVVSRVDRSRDARSRRRDDRDVAFDRDGSYSRTDTPRSATRRTRLRGDVRDATATPRGRRDVPPRTARPETSHRLRLPRRRRRCPRANRPGRRESSRSGVE